MLASIAWVARLLPAVSGVGSAAVYLVRGNDSDVSYDMFSRTAVSDVFVLLLVPSIVELDVMKP